MEANSVGNWDMTPFFSTPAGSDYAEFVATLQADIESLRASTDAQSALDDDSRDRYAELLCDLESVDARLEHLFSYLVCLSAADSGNEWVKQQMAAMESTKAEADKVRVALKAALLAASPEHFSSLLGQPALEGASYYVSRLRKEAEHAMSTELEQLAADLGVDGISAWGRLYDQVSGSLSFELEHGGNKKTVPVAMTRSLLESPDADLRAAALAGANKAWESASEPLAAALNAISGTRLTLYRRRGIDDFLAPARFDSGIEAKTLETMFEVVRARRSIPHRYYRLKAKVLGMDKLRFCDTMAPFPSEDDSRIPWDQAKELVLGAFGSFYPKLREFAAAAFDQRWIDYEPRASKRPGGFCTTSPVIGQSRVFMTYNQTSGDLQTLAHELGHAFHSALMKEMRYWQTNYPMTLAETASTFAEALVTDALLAGDLDAKQRLKVLDGKLSDAATFLCNTPFRFEFERSLYQERKSGEVSVSRICELMTAAQKNSYGDSLDQEQLDPWFWASKLHFYITEVSFYNFPYTFGYLFSLGIFARAKAEGTGFLDVYERLLRLTGSAPAEEVAREALGVELGEPEFWNDSIDLIEADLQAYDEALSELG
ncbi:MAG: M3 family oligoendopeptidase [Deltaproteobacteria bacterium]|nr:M3 family oligoendopeptidase [Deltaproteobacteria bacterium]